MTDSRMMNGGRPWWTPAQEAECQAHWARVRAGMHPPEAHLFRDDVGALIEMHRALARACIEGAARHMRHVEQLAAVDMREPDA